MVFVDLILIWMVTGAVAATVTASFAYVGEYESFVPELVVLCTLWPCTLLALLGLGCVKLKKRFFPPKTGLPIAHLLKRNRNV